ncbi:hypothetical protein CARUB_v10005419mg [Capsella rubella]|uniref:RING-type E3 ubiquitin transferase n=1 Tax=Capsella rubella TaxID=81985 RepID=R0F6K1_9BRAS|nr:E3 ubiquitin-protein ligase SINA-like 7 [Capsella rubella]EOA17151.1 hypothetical protein CARUB_v10005419mg [Capsella rubella]
MVETSISEASATILSRKREASSVPSSDAAKKRSITLLDLEILDCPICYEALATPIFQCDNGHIACSVCCPKLRNKCSICALPIGHSRCRAMESVLESILILCTNANFGCTKTVSYGDKSNHEKECVFSQCSCPALGCDHASSYDDLFLHYIMTHMDMEIEPVKFSCDISFAVLLRISDKVRVFREFEEGLLFVVQCFKEPCGVFVTVRCIAPSAPKVGEFSYHLSYAVDGYSMAFKSPEVKRVLEVSFEIPRENFLLIPNSLLRGETLDMKVCIKKLNQKVRLALG